MSFSPHSHFSQQPVTPRATAGSMPLTPFVVLGLFWGGVGCGWLAWAAGRIVAAVTGRHPGPGFGTAFLSAVFRSDWDSAFPAVAHRAVAGLFLLLLAGTGGLVGVPVVWWQRARTHAEDPLPSLARQAEVADLAPAGVTARAMALRPSLADSPATTIDPAQTGLALGSLQRTRPLIGTASGPLLRASWEDVVLALMGPRSGKTTSLAVPMLLDAPGAALATSNRADLWATTHAARARAGTVWVFDPQAITRGRQTWWWDPLAAIGSVEEATRMASHFLQPIRRGKGEDFWLTAAEDLLASLFLAGAVGGRTLIDVQAWLAEAADAEPVGLLDAHGYPQSARALIGRQHGAPETRDGIYETARTAAKCLQDPVILAWVTPPGRTRLRRFDPDTFPVSTDTLYLLSKDGAGSSAPLVAGLTDQVLRHGVTRAEERGGRLDPPLVAILDEAANICPIADLPQLYSHYGGRGINPVTILQNYAQGSGVWGADGMGTLWAAATVKLVGAGIDDPRFVADLSTLVGDHDVATLSITRDPNGTTSRQVSTRRQRILGPEHIRGLRRGTALLLAAGTPPALLRLHPWYTGPRAAELTAATEASIGLLSDGAEAARLAGKLPRVAQSQ